MTTRAALPLDRLLAAYNAILAVVWWSLAGRGGAAPYIALAHTAAVALPWLLDRGAGRFGRPVRVMIETYPLLWLVAFWAELGPLQALRRLPALDPWVAQLDRLVFGGHLHLTWRPAMPAPWFAETMYFVYFLYYAMIFGPPLIMLARRRTDAVRDILFRLLTAYLLCYLVYLVAPTYGPQYSSDVRALHRPDGFWSGLVHRSHALGDSPGTAFPSSHCAAVVTMAWFAWVWFHRRTAVLMTLTATAVVLSTIYTQNHYAIDSLAGVLVAVVVQTVLPPLAARAEAFRLAVATPLVPSFHAPGLDPDPPGGDS